MESVLEKKRKATVGYDVIFTEPVRYSDQLCSSVRLFQLELLNA